MLNVGKEKVLQFTTFFNCKYLSRYHYEWLFSKFSIDSW